MFSDALICLISSASETFRLKELFFNSCLKELFFETVRVKVLVAFFRVMFENVEFFISTVVINYYLGNSAPAFIFVFKICLVLNLKTCTELFTCKANIYFNCGG